MARTVLCLFLAEWPGLLCKSCLAKSWMPRERLYWLLSELVNLEIPEAWKFTLVKLATYRTVVVSHGSHPPSWKQIVLAMGPPLPVPSVGPPCKEWKNPKVRCRDALSIWFFKWTHHLLVVSKSIQFCVSNSIDSLSECKWCKCSEMTDHHHHHHHQHHHHHHLPLSNLCRSISRSCRGCSISQAIGPGFLPGIQLSTLLEQCLASFDTQALCIKGKCC